jgi:hypothetical protein
MASLRVIRGNKYRLPAGMTPNEWAEKVFALMDEGYSQDEAKTRVMEEAEDDGTGTN